MGSFPLHSQNFSQERCCFLKKSFQAVCGLPLSVLLGPGKSLWILYFAFDWICDLLAVATQRWVDTEHHNKRKGEFRIERWERKSFSLCAHTESGQKLWVWTIWQNGANIKKKKNSDIAAKQQNSRKGKKKRKILPKKHRNSSRQKRKNWLFWFPSHAGNLHTSISSWVRLKLIWQSCEWDHSEIWGIWDVSDLLQGWKKMEFRTTDLQ